MIEGAKNAAMKPEEVKRKTERYFFPGGGEYEPQTVEAGNAEEAEKTWEKERKEITK